MASSDDLMFEYLLGMGSMQPEQNELKRKQAIVEALRQSAMAPQQGQMVSGHYVAPGIGGLASQLGNAYMTKQAQDQVTQGAAGLNERQKAMLEELRRRRQQAQMSAGMYGAAPTATPSQSTDPYTQFLLNGEGA